MAITRVSSADLKKNAPKVDREKIRATTEEDIRRQMIEDGQDPDEDLRLDDSISPQVIRKRLGMTQDEFAKAIHVPVATLRNWEQGRVAPDPAARALLKIVSRNPRAALKALAA